MDEDLRKRLEDLHDRLEIYKEAGDAPISLDIQEIKDLCELLDTFLYEDA